MLTNLILTAFGMELFFFSTSGISKQEPKVARRPALGHPASGSVAAEPVR